MQSTFQPTDLRTAVPTQASEPKHMTDQTAACGAESPFPDFPGTCVKRGWPHNGGAHFASTGFMWEFSREEKVELMLAEAEKAKARGPLRGEWWLSDDWPWA